MIISGRMSSINVQKVVLAAAELELPFERIDAGGAFGVVNTPEYRAKNPNGLVPVLEDGAHVLWESNAIVRYLAARYGGHTLWVQDPGQRALCDRWMDWQTTALAPAMGPAFMNLIRTPPDRRDMAAVEASRAKAETVLAILDAHLEGRVYLEWGRLTMADVAMAPSIHRWLNLPLERESRPNVELWYERICSHPSAQVALPTPIS